MRALRPALKVPQRRPGGGSSALSHVAPADRPGTVDGSAVAATLVQTLRDEKVRAPGRMNRTRDDDGHLVLFGLGLG